ncbi:MAG: hypothetical protein IAG10_06105, partial [Planctomycetaceae bacterium]|nr:hypothetical protein [Planctomycetaceae bacterium]
RVFALWAILVGPVVSGASEDDDPAEDAPAKAVDLVAESNFDQWVFQERVQLEGNRIVHRSGTAVAARAKIDSQLKSKLDELVQVCQLDEAQQRKLALAARGDIKRFFDQVEEVRKKFLAVKNDQNRLNQIWQEISPLQQQYSKGLFGEESLFAKTLRKTLTDEQQAKYQADLDKKRRDRYRMVTLASLIEIERTVPLQPQQREKLQQLLLEGTQPPLLFGQYDNQVVMLGLSKLPAAKLKEVLDKDQWKRLQPQLLQASGTEDYLAGYGVIEEPKANSGVVVRSVRTVVAPQNAAKAE